MYVYIYNLKLVCELYIILLKVSCHLLVYQPYYSIDISVFAVLDNWCIALLVYTSLQLVYYALPVHPQTTIKYIPCSVCACKLPPVTQSSVIKVYRVLYAALD